MDLQNTQHQKNKILIELRSFTNLKLDHYVHYIQREIHHTSKKLVYENCSLNIHMSLHEKHQHDIAQMKIELHVPLTIH